jgi:hypothetical protein
MAATLREMRLGDPRMKIAAHQRECAALERKSSSPSLTAEERLAISHLQEQAVEHCQYLQHKLSLYERQSGSRRCISSWEKVNVLWTAWSSRSASVLPAPSGRLSGRYEGNRPRTA